METQEKDIQTWLYKGEATAYEKMDDEKVEAFGVFHDVSKDNTQRWLMQDKV